MWRALFLLISEYVFVSQYQISNVSLIVFYLAMLEQLLRHKNV